MASCILGLQDSLKFAVPVL